MYNLSNSDEGRKSKSQANTDESSAGPCPATEDKIFEHVDQQRSTRLEAKLAQLVTEVNMNPPLHFTLDGLNV